MNWKYYFIYSLLFLIPSLNFGQSTWGAPFLKNFSYKEYSAHTQNFCATQNSDGVFFFGNFEGVLIYDGITWSKISTYNNTRVTCLLTDTTKLYVGAENELGYIRYNSEQAKYTPIRHEKQIGRMRTFFRSGEQLYGVSESHIFTIDGDSISIKWQVPNSNLNIQSAFSINQTIYIETGYQLWKYTPNGLLAIPSEKGTPSFMNTVQILPFEKQTLLITEGYGVMKLRNDSIVLASEFDNKVLDNQAISTAILGNENDILIATKRNGIYRFSTSGELLEQVGKTEGIQNNTVNNLFKDNNGKVWALLNKGITLIDFYSPFRYINKTSGLRGEIFGVTHLQEASFLYGSQGAYTYKNGVISPVRQISSACWDVAQEGETLFFATSKGVLMRKNSTWKYLTDRFTFSLLINPESGSIYTGEIDGVGKLKQQNKTWKDAGLQHTTSAEVKKLHKVGNQLWVDMHRTEVAMLDLTSNKLQLFSQENMPQADWISYKTNVLRNELLLTTRKGIFRFQEGTFVPYQIFENDSAASTNVSSIVPDLRGNIWYSTWNETSIGFAKKGNSTFLKTPKSELNYLDNFICWDIDFHPNQNLWLVGPDGAMIFRQKTKKTSVEVQPLIRELRIGEDSILFTNALSNDLAWKKISIPYDLNSIAIKVGTNASEVKGDVEFQYWLDGNGVTWSDWAKTPHKEYSNLSYGLYTLKIRARNIYKQTTNFAQVQIHIKRPFSRTYLAYFLYFVAMVLLVYVVIRWRINNLRKEKLRLENIIQERTEEVTTSKTEIELKSQVINNQNEELQRINQIVQAINAEIDFTNLLHSILERLKVVKGMDAAVVLQVKENNFVVDATWGFAKDKLQGVTLKQNAIEDIFTNEAEEFFDELFLQDNIASHDSELLAKWNNPVSAVTLSITIDSQVKGYLILTNHSTPAAFDGRDQSLLRNLKEHLVSAFIKTSLLENVQQSNKQLSTTNAIISKQQADIKGSIQYASRIQRAVMPSDTTIRENLPDNFVLLRPRDIVSGDFYWLQPTNNEVLYAAADCTGHGVPGAFVSMLAISFLNEIVNRERIMQPAAILEALRSKVKSSLNQNDPKAQQKDGLDIALCSINYKNKTLQYSGAYNSLYLIRNNELTEIKATRNPIAVFIKEKPFENHEIPLQDGDVIYSFSDGYADQFGGEKAKKLYSKRFKEILLEIHKKPMADQREDLLQRFEAWRGKIEQIDDVLVFGVRI